MLQMGLVGRALENHMGIFFAYFPCSFAVSALLSGRIFLTFHDGFIQIGFPPLFRCDDVFLLENEGLGRRGRGDCD